MQFRIMKGRQTIACASTICPMPKSSSAQTDEHQEGNAEDNGRKHDRQAEKLFDEATPAEAETDERVRRRHAGHQTDDRSRARYQKAGDCQTREDELC